MQNTMAWPIERKNEGAWEKIKKGKGCNAKTRTWREKGENCT